MESEQSRADLFNKKTVTKQVWGVRKEEFGGRVEPLNTTISLQRGNCKLGANISSNFVNLT